MQIAYGLVRISAGVVGILLNSVCEWPSQHRDRRRGAEAGVRRVKFWPLATNHQERRIFGACFRRAILLGVDKILAIFCRANSPDITKDLRKVLLGLEAVGNSYVQYPCIGSTQHGSSTRSESQQPSPHERPKPSHSGERTQTCVKGAVLPRP